MQLPVQLGNLINTAKLAETKSNSSQTYLEGVIITPKAQIKIPRVIALAYESDYVLSHSDRILVKVELPPGVFINHVLPHKDNLTFYLVKQFGLQRIINTYSATPLSDIDAEANGSISALSSLSKYDLLNVVNFTFQLMDTGYSKIKNVQVNGSYLITNVKDVLHSVYVSETQKLGLNDTDTFKGVDIEDPVDNTKTYRSITLPQLIKLTDVANYLQNGPGYGIYTRGLGSYYIKGMWYVYPIAALGRYGTKDGFSLDVIKMPSDSIPTLTSTFYSTNGKLTVLATGNGDMVGGTDISKQNSGVGQLVQRADAIAGDVGVYINNGRAVKTRADSMVEYKTSDRSSGDQIIPINTEPTNNYCREISKNAFMELERVTVEWHNSARSLLKPGMATTYYYMTESGGLKTREGTLIKVETQYLPNEGPSAKPLFREFSLLTIVFPKNPDV